MKKKTVRGTLKPEKGSGAKERDGLLTQEHVLPEDPQELAEWANSVQSVTAIDNLNNIISYCGNVEVALAGQPYEELGPTGLAHMARHRAELAIKFYEEDNFLKAMQYAMSAVHNRALMKFTLDYERPAALGISICKSNQLNILKRWSADEARADLSGIVSGLASRKDELGDPETPSNLWPLLFSELESLGIRVSEGGASESIRDSYYQIDGLKDPYKYDAFSKAISRLRG